MQIIGAIRARRDGPFGRHTNVQPARLGSTPLFQLTRTWFDRSYSNVQTVEP